MNSDIIVINSLENQLKVLVARTQRFPKISEKLTDCFLFMMQGEISGVKDFFSALKFF